MTPDILEDVQRKGWQIGAVQEDCVLALCKRPGCGVKLMIQPGTPVPNVEAPSAYVREFVMKSFHHMRKLLRQRREELNLTIQDVEEIAGFATAHLAKFERDGVKIAPNMTTVLTWCDVLGFEVILRPKQMPPQTLGVIAETRWLVRRRQKWAAYSRTERKKKPLMLPAGL